MANEEVLGPRKTMFVLVIVVGCFAVLWPRILSPLILGPSREQLKPNQFDRDTAVKQERPPIRGAGPHPALRERGRAIPPGTPAPPTRGAVTMPPNVRVRSSPLSVYFELDIKPPPIPGMRPPLGSPGGPVPAPKSSMGFVMPIYTICIIVFFVYTLSKILFKRTGTSPYEPITSDPQFRRRVFRDDSRASPDKLGDVELEALKARLAETERAMQRIVSQLAQRDAVHGEDVVTAISGLVAEVQQQMEASYAQNQQWQDLQQDNQPRPYTNGTILHNSGPVHIVASEYQGAPTEKTTAQKDKDLYHAPESLPKIQDIQETIPETDEDEHIEIQEIEKIATDNYDASLDLENREFTGEFVRESTPEPIDKREPTPESERNVKDPTPELDSATPDVKTDEEEQDEEVAEEEEENELDPSEKIEESVIKPEVIEGADVLIKAAANDEKIETNGDIRKTHEFLQEEASAAIEEKKDKQSTPELLEDAIKDENDDNEKSSVKVVGMEMTAHLADGGACGATPPAAPPPRPLAATAPPPRAHEAESVQSIFLETEIPQQSRVLVADFAEDRADKPQPTKHSPMVVSGKMTLSLIQDAPRDTPERDQESTMDDFTTASAVTQNASEKQDVESDEEIEEEIEIEEIEEEVEEEEEEEAEQKPKELNKKAE